MSLVGNRPQFVKAAPLSRALRARGTEILVHSGQHYDPELAELFFDELAIPTPDYALGVGKGTPLGQIAAMLTGLEELLAERRIVLRFRFRRGNDLVEHEPKTADQQRVQDEHC